MMWFTILILWMICSVIAVGYEFAYFQRQYPSLRKSQYDSDANMAMTTGFLGPVALFACFMALGTLEHGWLMPYSAKSYAELEEK